MSPRNSGNGSFLQGAAEIVLAHLENEHFGVSELARELGMSRSNLHRKIHTITGKSASQFIREVRLNKAMELLKESDLTSSEVAYRVGFSSATYFSKCFHDHFGYPPGEVTNGSSLNEPELNEETDISGKEMRKLRALFPWVLLTLVALVAVVLIVTYGFPNSGKSGNKSVVLLVLPIRNDSPDHSNDYMVNGLMEEIMTRLSSIEEISVLSRITSEHYRNKDRSIKEIGKETQADYVLEGSVTILNSQTRIRMQLIETETDRHIWAEPFERVINQGNLINVQKEVSMAVSSELSPILKKDHSVEIEGMPTENQEAYKDYLLAMELRRRNVIQNSEISDSQIMRAKKLLERAIQLDPNFIDAYLQLSGVFIFSLFYTENAGYSDKAYVLMDSGLYYADKVLSFYKKKGKEQRHRDLNYAEALNLKGRYYAFNGDIGESEQYFNEAHNYMNMTVTDYENMASGCNEWRNYYGSVMNYLQSKQIEPEDYLEPGWSISAICRTYRRAGFPTLAREESQRLLDLNGDTIGHYNRLALTERYAGHYEDALTYLAYLCRAEPTDAWYCTSMSRNYIFMGKDEEAIRFLLGRIDSLKKDPLDYTPDFILGYVFLHAGMEEKGDSILQNYIRVMSERCRYPLPATQAGFNTYNVARAYSILGNRERTLEYLKPLKEVMGVDQYLITELKDWPTFDFVRDTPEFQGILSTLEQRFNESHEQIARLLEDHGIDPA